MKSVIVVDHFYENPELVRELALQSTYQDVRGLNYPGLQSEHSFYSEDIIQRFQELIGDELDPDVEALTFGKFRFMSKDSGSRIKVHVDGLAEWTGLVYLNPREQCEGGTAFYRHKASGLEGPPDFKDMDQFGFDTALDFEKKIIEKESLNLDNWEETHFVGMRFNRLVLFRGNDLFHCHTHGFGEDYENSRLTQNFFFNTMAKARMRTSIYAQALK